MERLRTRPEYLAVASGVRIARPSLVLQAAPAADEAALPRFGFTVTKKTGKAVIRNRIRRRLKEAVRVAADDAARGVDYVVVGRRGALDLPFSSLLADVAAGLAKAGSRPRLINRLAATEKSDGK